MVASVEDDDESDHHDFWYAQVLAIFSLQGRLKSESTNTKRLDILWVRWLGRDPSYKSGWRKRRLHRVGFVPEGDDPGAFGFLDPKDVIRAIHLIPAFAHGRSPSLLQDSFVKDHSGDWAYYYVNW